MDEAPELFFSWEGGPWTWYGYVWEKKSSRKILNSNWNIEN